MKRALFEYKITGVKTSISFLEKIMDITDFRSGKYNTHFIENNSDLLFNQDDCDADCEDIAIITAYIDYLNKLDNNGSAKMSSKERSKWKDCGRRKGILRF